MRTADLAALEALITTSSLPELGPGPRKDVLSMEELSDRLRRFFETQHLPAPRQQAFQAAALLWHDHLEASHRISQDLQDANGSFLHGIMHRREPDYSNAKYWFRHTGRHPAFPEIARRVRALGEAHPELGWALDRLLPRADWDAFAFVDFCEEAASLPGTDPRYQLLQEIQALEFRALLAHLAAD